MAGKKRKVVYVGFQSFMHRLKKKHLFIFWRFQQHFHHHRDKNINQKQRDSVLHLSASALRLPSTAAIPSSLIMSSIILSHSTSTCRHVVFYFWNECPQIFILSSLSWSNTWMQQKKYVFFFTLLLAVLIFFASEPFHLIFFASSSLLGGLLIWIYGSVFNVFFQLIFFLS